MPLPGHPMYRLREAGSRYLSTPVKAPAKAVWRRWGRFASNAYARYYFTNATQTWKETRWLGNRLLKNPMDLWIYQEILAELRPALVVETGTYLGGSALYFASIMDLLDTGRVLTIDVNPRPNRPVHPRIEYMSGSSTAPETIDAVANAVAAAEGPVMVVLDSAHDRDHVFGELEGYYRFVSSGSYLIVEDTAHNGHPVAPFAGPGPWEAVHDFLPLHPEFSPDLSRQKFMHTWNPEGYLLRS
jgi:cephalosporin hydroxylase